MGAEIVDVARMIDFLTAQALEEIAFAKLQARKFQHWSEIETQLKTLDTLVPFEPEVLLSLAHDIKEGK